MFGGAPHVRVGPDVLFVVFCLGFVSGAASQDTFLGECVAEQLS